MQAYLTKSLRESESWALKEYASALVNGDNLASSERSKIIDKITYYTGLSTNYIKNCNLRINQVRFAKELLRNEKKTVGIMDSRVKGIDSDAGGESTEFDPALFLVTGPYAAAMNDYLRKELKFETDSNYEVLNLKVNREWNWGSAAQGFVTVADTMREAMSKNYHLKVFIGCSYFDLATPYFAAHYTINHLGLAPDLTKNIVLEHYDAGHQMYTHLPSLQKLAVDASGFINDAVSSISK